MRVGRMEEVDGLGGGKEVGRFEFRNKNWVQGLREENKKKVRCGKQNSEREGKIKT